MAYNVNKKATVGQLKSLATKLKTALEAAIADLPVEQFLDQAKTQFVQSFTWSNELYPDSTNPSFDGKPVLVLALHGQDSEDNDTTTYSFLNMAALVDTYTVKSGSENILSISGREIEVKIDPDESNQLEVTAAGLKVASIDISGKADKVSSATSGDLAGLDGDGNLTDSGIAASDVMQKVSGATANHIAKVNANGEVEDGGILVSDIITSADIATDAEVSEMLTEVFGE